MGREQKTIYILRKREYPHIQLKNQANMLTAISHEDDANLNNEMLLHTLAMTKMKTIDCTKWAPF